MATVERNGQGDRAIGAGTHSRCTGGRVCSVEGSWLWDVGTGRLLGERHRMPKHSDRPSRHSGHPLVGGGSLRLSTDPPLGECCRGSLRESRACPGGLRRAGVPPSKRLWFKHPVHWMGVVRASICGHWWTVRGRQVRRQVRRGHVRGTGEAGG